MIINKLIPLFLIFCIGLSFAQLASAQICTEWSKATEAGQLGSEVDEASGMVNSPLSPSKLYHINDSGGGGEFFISDFTGNIEQKILISGFSPFDLEDMDVGPCPAGTCLFLADIGDNNQIRSTLSIAILADSKNLNTNTKPIQILKVKYGDRKAHNAESLMVHPNGDLYIITKVYSKTAKKSLPSKVFKLSRQEIWNSSRATKTMQEIGEIDFPAIIGNDSGYTALPTAAQIHFDGNRFMVLTYSDAIEFFFDLSKGIPKIHPNMYSVIPIPQLRQQESLAYSQTEDAFYYSTEGDKASIMKVQCLNRLIL